MTRETRIVAVVLFFYVWSDTSTRVSAYEIMQWDHCWRPCKDDSQSPVNINTQDVITQPFPPLQGTFYSERGWINATVRNIKYTVRFTPLPRGLYLEGGPLQGRYFVDHLEFRWSAEDNVSSEHAIDGKKFVLEAQWTLHSEKYSNYEEGGKHPGGVAVMSLLFPESEDVNSHSLIIDRLHGVEAVLYPNPKGRMVRKLNYAEQFSGMSIDDYYTYNGSFTRPPYSENVIWLVYVEPNVISKGEMYTFYRVYADKEHYIHDNCRPLQPLNGRQVMQSDKSSRVTGESTKGSQVAERPASRSRGAGASPQLGAANCPVLSVRHH